jgi:uncharacterized protein DUF3237
MPLPCGAPAACRVLPVPVPALHWRTRPGPGTVGGAGQARSGLAWSDAKGEPVAVPRPLDDPRRREFDPIGTEPLFDMVCDLTERYDLGTGPNGRRIVDRVSSGTFAGPRLRGEVLAGSADWGSFRPDGIFVLDARLVLRTDDGALIHMSYTGRGTFPAELRPQLASRATRHEIDPSRYYFRTTPLFETAAPAYDWLNGVVAIGRGYLVGNGGIGYQVLALR